MTMKAKIRRMHDVQGISIHKIVEQTGLSRNTIRKIIRDEKVDRAYAREQQNKPKLGQYEAMLTTWLVADSKLRRKERRTAKKCYTDLRTAGYRGAYDSVQRYVKDWKRRQGQAMGAYIPLCFEPADAYQFDWSEEWVEIAGKRCKIKLAHFRLCHSRAFFVVAYWRETQEMLIDAHNQAFSFFGGLPNRGIYDNMKTAVSKVLTGKGRHYTRSFISLMDHYRIEPVACTPGAGWEKGQVENQVDMIRDWLFRPCLKSASLESLNTMLRTRCEELMIAKQHPVEKVRTIAQIFAEERCQLRQMTALFDGHIEKDVRVSSTCLVRFEKNAYSVESAYANSLVTLRIYPNRIEAHADHQMIANHQREFSCYRFIFNPWHYVPLLEKKPGALRDGAPFKDWKLPSAIEKVKAILLKRQGGDRECVTILNAIRDHSLEALDVACQLALQDNMISQDVIINILNRLHQEAVPDKINTPLHLVLNHAPVANCEQYDQLLQGGGHD